MSIRKKIVGSIAGLGLVAAMGLSGASSASAYPGTPLKGHPCANVNFERGVWYRYYHKTLDTYSYCYYRVADYFFIGAHGKIRDLPDVVINKR